LSVSAITSDTSLILPSVWALIYPGYDKLDEVFPVPELEFTVPEELEFKAVGSPWSFRSSAWAN
jgi:hypothetical protein